MDMMELDGLASIDALFGIDGLKEDLMDVGILGASAGAAVIGGEYLFKMLDENFAKMQAKDSKSFFKPMTPYVKSGVAVVLGAAGGIAAGRFVNKAVGAGIASGLIGWGVAKAVVEFWKPKPEVKLGPDGKPMAGYFGQMSDRDLLLGMSANDYSSMPGQTSAVDNEVNVTDYRPIPGQTNGLGQASNVFNTELHTIPGQNGSSGFMAGLASVVA